MTEYSKQALTADIDTDVRKLAFRIVRNVTLATPVYTGRARGNWQVGIDTIKTSIVAINDKSGGITISSAASELAGVEGFNSIWITNNLPYISSLNDGSSTQAPKKFVETGIKRALND